MNADLVILVPVLDRPHRVAPLLDSIEAATPGRPSVLFLTDGRGADFEEIERQEDEHPGVLVLVNPDGGTYAEKINRGLEVTEGQLAFLGADDLEFRPGWLEAAKSRLTDRVKVVGVNDLLRRRAKRRDHATHFLVDRSYYGTIDEPDKLLHEGYGHCFVDDELIATAKKRGVYAYAPDSQVRHLHWMSRSAPDDDTYRKGRERFEQDRTLFHERSALWA